MTNFVICYYIYLTINALKIKLNFSINNIFVGSRLDVMIYSTAPKRHFDLFQSVRRHDFFFINDTLLMFLGQSQFFFIVNRKHSKNVLPKYRRKFDYLINNTDKKVTRVFFTIELKWKRTRHKKTTQQT